MRKVWPEPLDHKGNATYSIDFSEEMTAMSDSLSSVVTVLSQAAIDAGLSVAFEQIVGDVYKLKFSIPDPADQVFTAKGKPLDMEVTYTSTNGEVDSLTAVVIIKDK